jgi:mono/diheme cytochrome c family protein
VPSSPTPAPDSERGFKLLLTALGVATVLLLLLWAIDITNKERSPLQRWLPFLAKNPQMGEALFREKGCVRCHAMHGAGGASAPDLGQRHSDSASLAQLVSAMWNHAPQMWQAMQADQVAYPELSYEQTSALVSFLYMSRHVDPAGNAERGHELVHSKGCSRCHAIRAQGGHSARDLASLALESPTEWTQSILDSSAEMKASMDDLGMSWPKFAPHEFNDLLAYLREINPSSVKPGPFRKGDANAGWEVFQSKSCLVCHSVKDERGRLGPSLGASSRVAGTFSDMAAHMWNATPKMEAAMAARRIPSPRFKNTEVADLFAFLYTLQYFEPGGSPQLGRNVFRSRGCARCHGEDALGATAPALRGRHFYNSISLAAELWTHGKKMHEKGQQTQQPWPTLQESDVGDLIAFLNQPPSKKVQ